ncbi:MAG: TIR domain-containing protein [Candidatus Cryptobacteroides sp.]
MKSKYDIFISYRRTSYDTANLIATRLKAAGYSVFFDVETLRSGKFNEQLFGVIQQCKDFLLILPPGALDRCASEDDWVRLEVMSAMKHNKNIIPVLLNGFQWPEQMPSGMEELKNYQALTASSIEYFDMSMSRLQEKYLSSKSRRPFVKAIKVLSIVALSIAILIAALWFTFVNLSKGVCEQYADSIVKDASAVYSIVQEHQDVTKVWTEYANAVKYRSPEKIISNLKGRVIDAASLAETNINTAWTTYAVSDQAADISAYHSFLLSLHGISVQELQYFPVFCTLYYQDYMSALQQIIDIEDHPNDLTVDFISMTLSSQEHQFIAFYAELLLVLSSFPKQALSSFNSVASEWIYFPRNIKIGESQQYYEDIISNEMKLAEDLIADVNHKLAMYDAQLNELQEQLDGMVAEMNGMLTEVEREAIKDLENTIEQTYSGLKKTFSFQDSEDQWTKWGKIKRWGKFLSNLVNTYEDAEQEGYLLSTFVSPESVSEEIGQMLTEFQKQYPDSKNYVPSAKSFFKQVADGKREYAGILVCAIAGDQQHPFFKVGDIITAYNGVEIQTTETLSAEYKKSPGGTVSVDRFTDGHFVAVSGQMVEPERVAFLDLVE